MRGLDFNTNAANLLASGAADGETLVWDLTNPAAPNNFKVVRLSVPTVCQSSWVTPNGQADLGACILFDSLPQERRICQAAAGKCRRWRFQPKLWQCRVAPAAAA